MEERRGALKRAVTQLDWQVLKGTTADQRSDIWAVGVLLFEMIAGYRPFRGEYKDAIAYQVMNQAQEPLTSLRTGVPMELERMFNKALAKNPDKRYQGMADLLREVNTAAYQEYLKGRYFWLKRNVNELRKAVDYFSAAIALDSTFAPPHSGLADAYLMMANYGPLAPSEAYEKARAAAMKSLEIDRGFAEAHASLGFVHLVADWNWELAEEDFRRAIALNPNYSNAYNGTQYSWRACGDTKKHLS